jgi:signal transduction histidine kinase
VSDATPTRVEERRPRGRRSQAFDVALALLATGAELALLLDDGTASLPAILLTIGAGGALVWRRSVPLVVLAATLAAATASVSIDEPPGGVSVLIALYTTAALLERRVSLAALVPTVVLVTTLSVVNADGDSRSSLLAGAIGTAPLTVGIWALGAYVQTRRRYTHELEARALRLEREREQLARIAVHEERASISRELHDIVAHSVSVMLVGVRGARDVLRISPDTADETLARVETSGEQSLAELRRILALLRSPEQSAELRPQPSLANLDELVGDFRAAGLPVRLEVMGNRKPLAGGVELSVFRIVQEALTNVLKHTHPTRVTVTLAFRDSGLEVEVVDDGARRNDESEATTGQGIIGMRERVALLGGQLDAGRRVGGGFRVAARLPIGGDG